MMRILGAFMAAGLWSIICAAQTPLPSPPGFPQPPRDTAVAAPATAIIRGHVFDAGTGQPLRKAQVRAFSPELRENRLAVTDNSGAYEIKELAAGRYSLTASKGSFVNLQYGQTRPFEPGKPLEIHDAQLLDKVDFRLPRGGVITGRVVDEAGEPTSDVQVSALRYQYFNGRRQLMNAGRFAATNDVGEFRLFALPPGQYYISAQLRNINSLDSASSDRSGYAPTYFPGTPNVNEAQRVTIGVGQMLTDMNIALSPTKLARVSGVVLDSNGRPLVNAFVNILQVNGPGALATTGFTQVRPDGSFSVGGVAPGEYVIRANSAAGPGMPPEIAQATVTVAGDDLHDVVVSVLKMATVTGRVIPPPQSANFSFAGLQLAAAPASPIPLVGRGGGRVNEDGTFIMQVQPGLAFVRMNAVGAFSNVRIRSVRVQGVETIDAGIEFKDGQNVDGVEIELTNQLSSVSGVVSDARGNVVKDYTVVTFARDRERWGPGTRYLNTGRPDQDGKYKLLNLPPGDYYAIALDYMEPGASGDPEFLDRVKDRATEFSITEAENKSLDLKLVTGI